MKDTQTGSGGAGQFSERPASSGGSQDAVIMCSLLPGAAAPALLFPPEPAWVVVHTGAWEATLQPLPALPRPEHAESLRWASPSQGPKLSGLSGHLDCPSSSLYWWLLRVLPFPSQKYDLNVSGNSLISTKTPVHV